MASGFLEEVELGFAEKPVDLDRLTSPYFPSKIGGKPAWLDHRLPLSEDLVCRKCNKPRVFLLQVYAPIDHLTHCYHRTLYIFCCREPSCHSRISTNPFLVLRCNLPQVNPLYNENLANGGDVRDKNGPDTSSGSTSKTNTPLIVNFKTQDDSVLGTVTNDMQSSGDVIFNSHNSDECLVQKQQKVGPNLDLQLPPLCIVCGAGGPKSCAKCHSVNYCSREHQVIHWKAGHKKQCGDEKQSTTTDVDGGILFEEFEIVTEPEPPITVTTEKSEEERLKDYHKFLEQHSGKCDPTKMDKIHLDEVEKDVKKDKQFMTFKKRVATEPDQVSFIIINFIMYLL